MPKPKAGAERSWDADGVPPKNGLLADMGCQAVPLSAAVGVRRIAIVRRRGPTGAAVRVLIRLLLWRLPSTQEHERQRMSVDVNIPNEGGNVDADPRLSAKGRDANVDSEGVPLLRIGRVTGCAQIVPNRTWQDKSERHRTQRLNFASCCKCRRRRGLGMTVEGLKIRRASALGGSTPPPGTTRPTHFWSQLTCGPPAVWAAFLCIAQQ